MAINIDENIVRRTVFRIYQQRMRDGRSGDDKQDWFEAIAEVKNG